jgi:hypothetical protein
MGQIGPAGTVGQEAVGADAREARGQDVAEETADKGLSRQRQHPCPVPGAAVAVAKTDLPLGRFDQSAVGNGDPVGVTGQVGENGGG